MEIIQATIKDIPTIQSLSNIVWPVTFAPILTADQISYMMNMMYSSEALEKQIENDGHNYILLKEGDNYVGYSSYQLNISDNTTKVHKIYVLPQAQGKGLGKLLIEYVANKAREEKNNILQLNVNRYNKALKFYEKLGFTISYTEDIDIGNGFLMEDYVMEMNL